MVKIAATAELCLQVLLAGLPASMSVESYYSESSTCFVYFHFHYYFNFSLAAPAAMSVEFYLSIYRAGKWSMKVESRKCMKVESLRLVREQHTLQLEKERD